MYHRGLPIAAPELSVGGSSRIQAKKVCDASASADHRVASTSRRRPASSPRASRLPVNFPHASLPLSHYASRRSNSSPRTCAAARRSILLCFFPISLPSFSLTSFLRTPFSCLLHRHLHPWHHQRRAGTTLALLAASAAIEVLFRSDIY